MGIKTTTITEYYCDVCKAMCYYETPFKMITHCGDKDLDASYVYVEFKHFAPIDSSRGAQFIICKECRIDYLKQYLAKLENKS